jgi:peptide/nickel transport system ATP-binding protein
MALLEIRNLHLAMRSFDGEAHVLNGIDLSVERGRSGGWWAKPAAASR